VASDGAGTARAEAGRATPAARTAADPPARPTRRRAPGAVVALAIFAGSLAVFFAPALSREVSFLYRDNGRMHLPHKRLVAEALSRGELPQWNPHGGLGFPLVGGAVDAVQHPFNALLVLLPFDVGFKAWTLLSFLLAAMGTFAWGGQLGLSRAASIGGGLAVSLGGYLVSSTDNLTYASALATLPLLVAAAHAFVARGGRLRLAAVGLASGLAAAAGDPQSWGIAVAALPAYAAAFVERAGARRRDLAWRGVGALAAAVVGAAPFVAPVVAWLPHSSRGDPLFWVELERYNLLPLRALEFAVPGLFHSERIGYWSTLYEAYASDQYTPLPWVASEYLGVVVLAFALFAAARSRRAALLLLAAAAFAWMAMGTNAGFGAIARHVPVLSGFRYAEKFAFFTALLTAAAAMHGVDAFGRGAGSRAFAWIAGGCGIVLAGAFLLGNAAPEAALALVGRPGRPAESAEFAANLFGGIAHAAGACLVVALLAALRDRLSPRARAVAAVAILAADLAVANRHAYVVSPASLTRPPSPFAAALAADPGRHRVVSPFGLDDAGPPPRHPFEWAGVRGAASLQSGWNVDYRVGNFEPYTGMIPARAMRFRLRTGSAGQLPMVGMWGVDHVVVPGDPSRAAEVRMPPPYEVALADPASGTFLLRAPHRPRAYLAEEIVSVDRRGAMEFVLDPASVGSARTVVEAPLPPAVAPSRGDARIVEDRPERVVVEVTAPGPAFLVLNDTFAPGWTATIGGAPAEISPANYLARGVWTPPGTSRVTFTYSTPGLASGWAIAAAGAGALLASWAVARRRRVDLSDA
jgi:hypothetical protein